MLIRGGGSLEDLMPMMKIWRYVFIDLKFIVTGIGHQPDITIADTRR